MAASNVSDPILLHRWLSPAGELTLGVLHGRLCMCDWSRLQRHQAIKDGLCRHWHTVCREGSSPLADKAAAQLNEYFSGNRSSFDIPLLFAGTDFRKLVWEELSHIGYGTTISYAELARRIGRPAAVRAVANANAANPISIFVPCHRVIGADGSLTGYGGGLDAKRMLLDLESRQTTLSSH